MPVKPKHGKSKHPHHSKKSKAIKRQMMATARQHVETNVGTSVATAKSSASKTTTISHKTITMQYPYITSELRRIGILAGIILIVLIILAVILS